MRRQCKACGARFEAPIRSRGDISPRRTCSRECALKWVAMNRNQWSKEELEALKECANTGPTPFVVHTYNRWAKNNDKPKRSRNSIEMKLQVLGLSKVSIHQYYSRTHLANSLGIPAGTVISWTKYGLEVISPHPKSKEKFVTDKSIIEFAKKYPRKFGGIPYSKLFLVLGDHELCKFITDNYPKRPSQTFAPRRVICINTGKVYPSVRRAADENFLCISSVYKSCRLHKTRGGLDFRYFDPDADDWNPRKPNSDARNIVFRSGEANTSGE